MWRNYLTVGLRALARDRTYAFVNIFGLALGLAACLGLLLYVRYETTYDHWLAGHERVYQVQTVSSEPGQPVVRSQGSPLPVGETLAGGFPQIEAITAVRPGQTVLMRAGRPLFLDVQTVDPSFFQVFRLPFAHGSAKRALPDVNSIVLTEREAIRQFGTSDVVGRTMTLGAGEGRRDYAVSGVLRDLPRNSSLRLSLLYRADPRDLEFLTPDQRGWANLDQQHYVRLRRQADSAAINAALPAWERRTITPQAAQGRAASAADRIELKLVRIADVHLGEAQNGALAPGGNPDALATFALVAFMTLGMAVINFVNLSTARATRRAREVALRKVLGATRLQLVVQMLVESALMTAIAMLLALALLEVALPWIGAWADANLHLHYLGEGGVLLPALALLAATGLAGGLYPAFYLSRFRPAEALRCGPSSPDAPGRGRLMSVLVMVQFAIAIGLIVCTSIVYAQTRHAETIDPGYRRDGLIQLNSAWRFAGDEREYRAARPQLLALPGVVGVGRTNLGLAATNRNVQLVRAGGAAQDLSAGFYSVDPDFFRTMQMRLLAGRLLDESFANDRLIRPEGQDGENGARTAAQLQARGINIVVNRLAARSLGFASPAAAAGSTVRVGIDGLGLTPATIVGVVEDTRIRTARDSLEPIAYAYDPARTSQVIVRYAAARPAEVMAGLGAVWQRFEPEIPFQGQFAETLIADSYTAERARGALFAGFAALAVAIACLGLYALAAFTAARRTREIGIRKVLGARVRDIVRLLVWQFTTPVVVANLIAWPVAWWVMRGWLDGFEVRIALGPTPFALAGLLALAVAVGTVAAHAVRVARANPIHALRYE